MRLEDRPLLTGRGRFAADISFPQQLHMRIVRSNFAHGKLRAIDADAALALPGVQAVWTAADVADIPPIDFRLSRIEGLEPYRQRLFADGFVRYVGEPVAAVFADDPYLAEDAAELVALDIEELPAILQADEAPGEFEPGRSTEPAIVRKGYGEVDAAFRGAHAVVEATLSIGRHSGVPLETRGAIARYDAARDMLELHGAAKVPHWNRDQIARMLGRGPSSVHLFEGHVGGGFGIRGEIYPEDVLVCVAALRLQRPIKWIEDRREHLIAANHSRQQQHRVRAAVDRDGRILAIDDEIFHDQGAYMRTHAVTVPDLAAAMLPGPYRIPAYRANAHVRLTNKTPCGTYRAPGRFESTFVRERLVDAIAARLDLDPVEVRRRNLIASHEMPYARQLDTLGTEIVLDSGDYAGLLDKALAAVEWEKLRKTLAARKAAGELVGAGVAMFVEKSGLGPFDQVQDRCRYRRQCGGHFRLGLGGARHRDGDRANLRRCARRRLSQDPRHPRPHRPHRIWPRRLRLARHRHDRRGDADCRQRAESQGDRGRIRIAANAGRAAGRDRRRSGAQRRRGGPLRQSWGYCARALARLAFASRPSAGTFGRGMVPRNHMNYPYGVHIAVTRIDKDTGAVAIERYLVAYDVGKAVNPMLIEGQIVGGCAQGIGGTLLEEFLYDERGEPLSVTFADYLMPTVREMPPVDVLICEDAPSPLNPMGLKGAGEGGANAVGAAIAAAIDDALGARAP